MKEFLKLFIGNLRYRKKSDLLVLPLKYLYIICVAPFLLFIFMYWLRSLGGIKIVDTDNYNLFHAIVTHFCAVVLSFVLWGSLISVIIKHILH